MFCFFEPAVIFSRIGIRHFCIIAGNSMIPVLITLPFAVFGMVFQLSFITVGKAEFRCCTFGYGWSPEYCTGLAVCRIFHWGLAGGAVVDFLQKTTPRWRRSHCMDSGSWATSFLMMACNVFASGWFTALNDGKTSAILSFCRTVIFMIAPVLILPGIFGMDGVWMSITAGEVLVFL